LVIIETSDELFARIVGCGDGVDFIVPSLPLANTTVRN
jgi:hypothetical protein